MFFLLALVWLREHAPTLPSAAYNRLRLRPRILRDVANVNTKVTILGEKLSSPIAIAPTGKTVTSFGTYAVLVLH